jgi:hypothetical protein
MEELNQCYGVYLRRKTGSGVAASGVAGSGVTGDNHSGGSNNGAGTEGGSTDALGLKLHGGSTDTLGLKLHGLWLEGINLVGTLPASLAKLDSLEELTLHENRLHGE